MLFSVANNDVIQTIPVLDFMYCFGKATSHHANITCNMHDSKYRYKAIPKKQTIKCSSYRYSYSFRRKNSLCSKIWKVQKMCRTKNYLLVYRFKELNCVRMPKQQYWPANFGNSNLLENFNRFFTTIKFISKCWPKKMRKFLCRM